MFACSFIRPSHTVSFLSLAVGQEVTLLSHPFGSHRYTVVQRNDDRERYCWEMHRCFQSFHYKKKTKQSISLHVNCKLCSNCLVVFRVCDLMKHESSAQTCTHCWFANNSRKSAHYRMRFSSTCYVWLIVKCTTTKYWWQRSCYYAIYGIMVESTCSICSKDSLFTYQSVPQTHTAGNDG